MSRTKGARSINYSSTTLLQSLKEMVGEAKAYELDDLYLFPEFQNKGIGSMVIKKCCLAVNEPVMLYVFVRNDRAVTLYKRLGFEIIKTINESRYIMVKQ